MQRVGSGRPEGRFAGLTRQGPAGKFEGLPRRPGPRWWVWLMVCVRCLRTQQRVKNRCQLPRPGAGVVSLFGGSLLVLDELSFG